jgi:hypothetical protein
MDSDRKNYSRSPPLVLVLEMETGRGGPVQVEKIAIMGLQTMWLLPNRIPNVGFCPNRTPNNFLKL